MYNPGFLDVVTASGMLVFFDFRTDQEESEAEGGCFDRLLCFRRTVLITLTAMTSKCCKTGRMCTSNQ